MEQWEKVMVKIYLFGFDDPTFLGSFIPSFLGF